MSDYEDADFFREPWTSPPKRKAKKDSKKNKKTAKHKKSRPTKTHESVQKKKKNSKFKEIMMEKKEEKKEKRKEKDKDKKKEKKKKKKKLALNLDDDFKLADGSKRLAAHQNKNLNSSEKAVNKPKRKKIVAFGSLPSYIRVKRPIFTSSLPKETEAAREGERCSQVMGKRQIQPHDNDFQYNSDDINSQDLFITQKTFRETPSETSSSEASDRVISESPHMFMQRDKTQHTAAGEIKRCHETSDKGQGRATHQCLQKIKTEEEEEIHELLKHPNQAREKTASEHEGPNSFLEDLLVINPTPDAVSNKHCSSYRPYIGERPMRPALANTSTQTENFFTTELSSYLSFCQKNRASLQSQDMKPLDLSLPQRAREDLHLSGKMQNASEVKKEPLCHGEATPSPQSEAETKSANTTTSSEDDHHCRAGKRDMTQVGVVQLRLNKPFFFKTKGEGQSPRPDSPLMKLAQGRDVKSMKCHSGRKRIKSSSHVSIL